jgi:hypothetical protein
MCVFVALRVAAMTAGDKGTISKAIWPGGKQISEDLKPRPQGAGAF